MKKKSLYKSFIWNFALCHIVGRETTHVILLPNYFARGAAIIVCKAYYFEVKCIQVIDRNIPWEIYKRVTLFYIYASLWLPKYIYSITYIFLIPNYYFFIFSDNMDWKCSRFWWRYKNQRGKNTGIGSYYYFSSCAFARLHHQLILLVLCTFIEHRVW